MVSGQKIVKKGVLAPEVSKLAIKAMIELGGLTFDSRILKVSFCKDNSWIIYFSTVNELTCDYVQATLCANESENNNKIGVE